MAGAWQSVFGNRRGHVVLALLGALAFLLHAWLKLRHGLLPELLWGCNLTAVLLIFGFGFEWPLLVGTAFLWRLGLGDPGFLAGVWSGERYFWTAAIIHVVPTILAALYLRRSGLPRGSAWWGLGFCLGVVLLSKAFTPPELNVNFAFSRIPFLAHWFPGLWSYRAATSGVAVLMLFSGDALAARWFGRPMKS
ncbi:MAG TPA: hypothetical protein VJ600_07660 [Holophagaceae bacterium]|nr:hypothetical protein [Holophagaceae bacterium]